MSVSVQQASINAAVAFFQTQLPGIPITSRWPTKDFPGKAITLITAGSRRDVMLDPTVLSKTLLGTKSTKAIWQIAECTQPVQLDVWAMSFGDRDDLIARLDAVLHSGYSSIARLVNHNPVESFMGVELKDGWEDITSTVAQFSFDNVDCEDSAESMSRNQFRGTYRGNAYVKLAIPAVSPRQASIKIRNFLDGTAFTNTLGLP